MNSGMGLIAPLVQSFFTDHLVVSVRATPSFQPAHAFDAVGVWTNNDND